MKQPLLLSFLIAFVIVGFFASCKKEEDPTEETDWRKAYVGTYIGSSSIWTTPTGGSVSGPITGGDTMEIKLGPYPDKFRIDEIIFQGEKTSLIYQGYYEDEICDTVSGNFSSGGMSFNREKDCGGDKIHTVFLGSRVEVEE